VRSIILGCLLLPLIASAQTRVSVYTGMTFPSVGFSSGSSLFSPILRDSWYPGINFGVGTQIRVLDWIEVAPQFEYSHYLFRRFEIYTMGGPPFIQGSSGHPSRGFRFIVEGRLIEHASNGGTYYFSTGLAYSIVTYGTIDATWSPPYPSTQLNNPNSYFWAQTLGIGAHIRLSSVLLLDLGVRTFTNYRDPWDFSINSGVTYTIPR